MIIPNLRTNILHKVLTLESKCDDHYQHICLEAKHSLVHLAELRARFLAPYENMKFY
jgi:hypothetical protein